MLSLACVFSIFTRELVAVELRTLGHKCGGSECSEFYPVAYI